MVVLSAGIDGCSDGIADGLVDGCEVGCSDGGDVGMWVEFKVGWYCGKDGGILADGLH